MHYEMDGQYDISFIPGPVLFFFIFLVMSIGGEMVVLFFFIALSSSFLFFPSTLIKTNSNKICILLAMHGRCIKGT